MNTPAALTFVDPATVVNQLPLEPGSKVADFGCGSGYFSFEFAKQIGSDGLVYALDVLPSALEAVASRAKSLGLSNILTKRVNLERQDGSGLGAASMDWVIIKDMLFQNQKKDVIVREAARVLRPDGHAFIMEWHPNQSLVGPDKDLRVSPEELQKLISAVGLSLEKEVSTGGFHYAILAKKS
jgi:ubiquinone/menaquinone biosynthesis C-methylase UbiE